VPARHVTILGRSSSYTNHGRLAPSSLRIMRRSYDHTGAFQESLFGHAFHDVTTSFAAGIDGEITPTGHPPRCVQAGSRMDLPSPAPPRPGTPDPP
jgi:hypothetical protein